MGKFSILSSILLLLVSISILGAVIPVTAQEDECQCLGLCPAPPPTFDINPSPLADIVLRQSDTLNALSATSKSALAGYTIGGVQPSVTAGIPDAVTQITNRFNALGRKVEVVVSGHGNAGNQKVGSDTLNVGSASSFTTPLKGKVSSVHFFGCSVGGSTSFLQTVADGLGLGVTVDGYTSTIIPSGNASCPDKAKWCYDSVGSLVIRTGSTVPQGGGQAISIDKFGLLMPYVTIALTISFSATAVVIASRARRKRRK